MTEALISSDHPQPPEPAVRISDLWYPAGDLRHAAVRASLLPRYAGSQSPGDPDPWRLAP